MTAENTEKTTWVVTRSWLVQAATREEAVEVAEPGKHLDIEIYELRPTAKGRALLEQYAEEERRWKDAVTAWRGEPGEEPQP